MRPLRSSSIEVIGLLDWWVLLPAALSIATGNLAGLGWYRLTGRIDPLAAELPDKLPASEMSGFIAEAQHAAAGMSRPFLLHSERSWYFAMALAQRDGITLDPVLTYVACLLHDAGLFAKERRHCFAVEGARIATACGVAAGVADPEIRTVADAIQGHVSVEPPTFLGRYLQYGALLDIAGWRVARIDQEGLRRVCSQLADRHGCRTKRPLAGRMPPQPIRARGVSMALGISPSLAVGAPTPSGRHLACVVSRRSSKCVWIRCRSPTGLNWTSYEALGTRSETANHPDPRVCQ